MIAYGTNLLKMAREWFRDQGFTLLTANSTRFEDLRSTSMQTVIPGYEVENDEAGEIYIPANCIPLIAAILEDAPPKFLARLAKDQGAHENLGHLMEAFEKYNKQSLRPSGVPLSSGELMVRCLHAIESADQSSLSRAYYGSPWGEISITMALLNARSNKQWPIEILRQYQRTMDNGRDPKYELDVGKHNFLDLMDPHHFPRDDSGVRYDWLLERTGMLLPGVIKKSLGRFSAWEEFSWIGHPPTDSSTHDGFVDYCVDKAPDEQKPLIKQGLLSMVLETSHIADGSRLIDWMKVRFSDTYLEDVPRSLVLQMNLIRSDTNANKAIDTCPNSFPGLALYKETILARLCEEIFRTNAENMGLAHFTALSFIERSDFDAPPQVVSESFNREALLVHVLKGLDEFIPPLTLVSDHQAGNLAKATAGVASLVRQLSRIRDFEYDGFKQLNSRGVSILAMAGLNPKHLPRMNNRDKGRLLEQDLGM